MATVGVSAVVGQGLEEIGYTAELGDRIEQDARGYAVDLLETTVRTGGDAVLLRRCLGVVGQAEGAGTGTLDRGEDMDFSDRVEDRPVASARNHPHLRVGEGANLLDSPVVHTG